MHASGSNVPYIELRSHSPASLGCTLRTKEKCTFYREFLLKKIRGNGGFADLKKIRTIYGGVPYVACTLYGGSTVHHQFVCLLIKLSILVT